MDSIWAYLNEVEKQPGLTLKDLQLLELLSRVGDEDEKHRVAQICANGFDEIANAKIAKKILLRLLRDSDSIIAVNACDSLGSCNDMRVVGRLIPLLKHQDPLMRGYAALSISDIGVKNPERRIKRCKRKIRELHDREKESWVRLCCDGALCTLGDASQRDEILQNLLSKEDHVRYLALQLVETHFRWEDDLDLIGTLTRMNQAEQIGYIKDKLEKMLAALI